MKRENIIRAWKDEAYRMSLSDTERAMLPENPAGAIELSDAQLEASGAAIVTYLCTLTCTWGTKCPSSFCPLTIGCPIKK